MEKRPYIPFKFISYFPSEPIDLNIPLMKCPLEIHPRCRGQFIPTKQSPDNCLLCENFGSNGREKSLYRCAYNIQ